MGEGYHATYEVGFWKLVKYLIACLIIGFVVGVVFMWFNGPAWLLYIYLNNLWITIPAVLIVAGAWWIKSKTEGQPTVKGQVKQPRLTREMKEAAAYFNSHPEMTNYYTLTGKVIRKGGGATEQ